MLKLRPISTSPNNFQSNPEQSSSEIPKPKSYKGITFLALALTGFTVGIGYATLNPDSRRQIESIVPQSHQLFDYVDKFLSEKKIKFNPFENKPQNPIQSSNSNPKPFIDAKLHEESEKKPVNTEAPKANSSAQTEAPKDLDWKTTLKEFDLQEEATLNGTP